MPSDGTPTPVVYDHLRPTAHETPDGIYRVVGVGQESVALLRVGDADGRRVHTGEVTTVPLADLNGFESAENPDGNRSLGAAVASQLEGLYWQCRVLGRAVAANPLLGGAALAAIVLGFVDQVTLPVPDAALVLLGGFGLLYLARKGSN